MVLIKPNNAPCFGRNIKTKKQTSLFRFSSFFFSFHGYCCTATIEMMNWFSFNNFAPSLSMVVVREKKRTALRIEMHSTQQLTVFAACRCSNFCFYFLFRRIEQLNTQWNEINVELSSDKWAKNKNYTNLKDSFFFGESKFICTSLNLIGCHSLCQLWIQIF